MAYVGSIPLRMPRHDYKRCKDCGRFSKDVGLLSRHRLCNDCGRRNLAENVRQMVDRRGPNWVKWRRGMIRVAGGVESDSFPLKG